MSRHVLLLVLVALAAGVAGCGGEGAPAGDSSAVSVADGVQHIHGLGINPADGAVIVATHSGLFRAAEGQQRARRIGDRRQDTMGFTVVGADRFLGSGHPDVRDDLPPVLGLIRSDDAGRSWASVSLLGEVDFHVLRASGQRIYGVDAQTGALLVSGDAGRSWQRRTPPDALIDVAIDPRDPDRIVGSGEAGLFISRDAGRRWRPLDEERAGLLAWDEELVLVDGSGAAFASADGGRSWKPAGSIGGQPAALASGGDGRLLAATHENIVKVSDDAARTWRLRVTP